MEVWCQTVSVAGGGFESWVEEERRRHTVLGPVQQGLHPDARRLTGVI